MWLAHDGENILVVIERLFQLAWNIHVLLVISKLEDVEHAVAIILGVATEKKESSCCFADAKSNKLDEESKYHPVLVLTATVVEAKVSSFRGTQPGS